MGAVSTMPTVEAATTKFKKLTRRHEIKLSPVVQCSVARWVWRMHQWPEQQRQICNSNEYSRYYVLGFDG